MEKEEKFLIPKSKEDQLVELLDYLEETRFNFACFVSSFEHILEMYGFVKIDENRKEKRVIVNKDE